MPTVDQLITWFHLLALSEESYRYQAVMSKMVIGIGFNNRNSSVMSSTEPVKYSGSYSSKYTLIAGKELGGKDL
jgi:hypothetical protein